MFFKSNANPLELGAALPDVSATLHDGSSVQLASVAGAGYTLVYFYPKADTPGCTAQACSLRDAYAELVAQGVRVYGVSSDSVNGQQKFRQKYELPFDLIADADKVVINAFGVPAMMGFASRQAFLFKDGELVWRDLRASTRQQANDVLGWLNEHKGE